MSDLSNPTSEPGASGRYVTALLELLGSADPIAVLRSTPDDIRRQLTGRSPDAVYRSESSDKWSVAEVVAHLADSDLVWSWRLRLVISEERPELQGYDQDAWARRLRYREQDVEKSLLRFTTFREDNLALLDSLAPEELGRVALHRERGEESIEFMVRLYAGHDLVHLRQIDRILTAGG